MYEAEILLENTFGYVDYKYLTNWNLKTVILQIWSYISEGLCIYQDQATLIELSFDNSNMQLNVWSLYTLIEQSVPLIRTIRYLFHDMHFNKKRVTGF